MGIGQISVSQFPSAYPYGLPQSDLSMNLGAVSKFGQAMQEIQKQRYENQLLKALLGISQAPAGTGQPSPTGQPGQSSLAALLARQPVPSGAETLGQPAGLGYGGNPSFMPGASQPPSLASLLPPQPSATPSAAMPPTMPTPPPTLAGAMPPTAPPQGGLASLFSGQGGMPPSGGMQIPNVMQQRFNPPAQQGGLVGLLKGVGNAFNPMGQYRGAPTQLETLLLGERMKQMTPPERMTEYQKADIGIKQQALEKEKAVAKKGFSFHDGWILNQDTGEERKVVGYAKSQVDPTYTEVTTADGSVMMVNSKDPSDVKPTGLKKAVSESATKEYDTELEANTAAQKVISQGWRVVVVPTPSGKFKLNSPTPITPEKTTTSFATYQEALKDIQDNGMVGYYPYQLSSGKWVNRPNIVGTFTGGNPSLPSIPSAPVGTPVAKPILKDKFTVGQTYIKNGVTYKYIGNNQWQKI